MAGMPSHTPELLLAGLTRQAGRTAGDGSPPALFFLCFSPPSIDRRSLEEPSFLVPAGALGSLRLDTPASSLRHKAEQFECVGKLEVEDM